MRSARRTRTTHHGVIVVPWGKPVKTQRVRARRSSRQTGTTHPGVIVGALEQPREDSERDSDEINTPDKDDSPWGDRGALGQTREE